LTGRRIGFVSTRFAGTDSVSLETAKRAEALECLGHICFYLAGASDRPPDQSRILARRHYSYATLERRLQTLIADCFGE
jgi:hypothetical protein